jgi:hypothetical protein
MIFLVASAAARSQQPTRTGQTHSIAGQPDAAPHEAMKFKLLIMSNGLTKSGFSFGGMVYETTAQIRVIVNRAIG